MNFTYLFVFFPKHCIDKTKSKSTCTQKQFLRFRAVVQRHRRGVRIVHCPVFEQQSAECSVNPFQPLSPAVSSLSSGVLLTLHQHNTQIRLPLFFWYAFLSASNYVRSNERGSKVQGTYAVCVDTGVLFDVKANTELITFAVVLPLRNS
jgi:hypothetical protein